MPLNDFQYEKIRKAVFLFLIFKNEDPRMQEGLLTAGVEDP